MKFIRLYVQKFRNRIARVRRSQAWAIMVGVLAAYTVMAVLKFGVYLLLVY